MTHETVNPAIEPDDTFLGTKLKFIRQDKPEAAHSALACVVVLVLICPKEIWFLLKDAKQQIIIV